MIALLRLVSYIPVMQPEFINLRVITARRLSHVLFNRWSWHYNCVGPLVSMVGVEDYTKMQPASFLKV